MPTDTEKIEKLTEMALMLGRQLNVAWFLLNAVLSNLNDVDPSWKGRLIATLRTVSSSEPEGQLWIDEAVKIVESLQ
ncbi:MAG: hypothetical protein ACLQDV_08290 [Candidatus Binataceae bacterium]